MINSKKKPRFLLSIVELSGVLINSLLSDAESTKYVLQQILGSDLLRSASGGKSLLNDAVRNECPMVMVPIKY